MYTGNEKNPVQQIEIIKKNSRQKSSLLDTLIHHALLPMTILFMAIDALTIAYYAQNIFDERVELAWAVSGVLALVLDVSPALAGSLLANHSDLLKSDKRPINGGSVSSWLRQRVHTSCSWSFASSRPR